MSSRARIACFHGGGASAAIFRFQCDGLQKTLSDIFEFVFFDAPFESIAGPGVLPAFTYEEYGPYRTWFSKDGEGVLRRDGRGDKEGGESGIERVVRLIEEEGEGGEWVGCMGFSQGTRVIGGLLLEQMRLRKTSVPGFVGGKIQFKFGVLCNGGAEPMLIELSNPSNMDLIDIPTLHLHGLKDQNLENGRKQLANHFDPRTTTLMEIDYHHAMPWYKEDLLKFSGTIRKIYTNVQTV